MEVSRLPVSLKAVRDDVHYAPYWKAAPIGTDHVVSTVIHHVHTPDVVLGKRFVHAVALREQMVATRQPVAVGVPT
jgi:hypothetical protein